MQYPQYPQNGHVYYPSSHKHPQKKPKLYANANKQQVKDCGCGKKLKVDPKR
ncbi:hypothetical protein [Priestia endophytica]|jgi:hypothetical protein|uniref:hypothetical protein n=1 Tax=Priestia endophytica TaxID=135735 RepID=UPI000FC3A9FF|nr:hypothetical protein [Priestia endophytica]MED4073034.1 hypothetical protein [Priestia endophytica]RPK12534.1 hypothetical protein FH5_02739 [Priestia endophytica]